MVIRPANYSNMTWLGSLSSKPKDQAADLAKKEESETDSNTIEDTARIAFGLPPKTEDKSDAIIRASKEIADQNHQKQVETSIKSIKAKIETAGVDPVALGVSFRMPNGEYHKLTKEEWTNAKDVSFVETVAREAALKHEVEVKQAWQKGATKSAQGLSSVFDAKTSRVGKIMSAAGPNEDINATAGIVPANSVGILAPHRLDDLAKAENPHDKSVADARATLKAREQEKKNQLIEAATKAAENPEAMKQGQVIRAGGHDASVFSHRVPSNQVSMMDTMGTGTLTPDQIKESLSKLFTRVEDKGQAIREANKAHKEEIRGKEEKDRSWEQVQKPLSTSDLTKRLGEALWPTKKTGQ